MPADLRTSVERNRESKHPRRTLVIRDLISCPICQNDFIPKQRTGGKWTETCSQRCAQRRRHPVARPDDHRTKRFRRECSAPGLTQTQRYALLHKWRHQGRYCTYCDGPAETVDHVIPLWRGGTNYVGNLTPACRRCNSSKGTLFLIEWRTHLRLPPVQGAPTTPRAPRIPRARPVKPLNECTACGTPTKRNKFCSNQCWKDEQRNRYRREHGIPFDAPLHRRLTDGQRKANRAEARRQYKKTPAARAWHAAYKRRRRELGLGHNSA